MRKLAKLDLAMQLISLKISSQNHQYTAVCVLLRVIKVIRLPVGTSQALSRFCSYCKIETLAHSSSAFTDDNQVFDLLLCLIYHSTMQYICLKRSDHRILAMVHMVYNTIQKENSDPRQQTNF